MDKAIIVDHLVRNYEVTEKKPGLSGAIEGIISPKKKQVRALRGISFNIQPGELVGFIGPNGAGKTTTLKILSGLLFPTAGFTQVLGFDPWDRKPEFLKQISLVMGQKNQLWWDLPAIETLELNRAIYEIPKREYEESLEELSTLLNVKKLLNIQVRRLSLGQRMRLELIAALIHRPKVLFLDEPTIGLDLIAKQKIIKVSLTHEDDIKRIEQIGKVKKIAFPEVVLSVPREAVAVAAAELLQNFPVADLTIEEIPIEDVIRKVFRGEMSRKKH